MRGVEACLRVAIGAGTMQQWRVQVANGGVKAAEALPTLTALILKAKSYSNMTRACAPTICDGAQQCSARCVHARQQQLCRCAQRAQDALFSPVSTQAKRLAMQQGACHHTAPAGKHRRHRRCITEGNAIPPRHDVGLCGWCSVADAACWTDLHAARRTKHWRMLKQACSLDTFLPASDVHLMS